VDIVQREVMVLLPTGPTVFDVPCDCAILLRGEPIKLRVIQPGDQVRVTFTDCQVMKVARMLEVPPNGDPARPTGSANAFSASVHGFSATAGGQSLSSDAQSLAGGA
jgi:hypothetical protein